MTQQVWAAGAERKLSGLMDSETRSRMSERIDVLQKNIKEKSDAECMAKSLGWFSIGLGVAEVLAPTVVARAAGLEGKHPMMVRLFGLREIASGIGIFAGGKRPASAVWARVFGDVLDIAALGSGFLNPKSNKGMLTFAAANVLTVTALDVITARQLSIRKGDMTEDGSVRIERSIFVNRSPEECYAFWRKFEQFPHFMRHLKSVSFIGDGQSHWVAKGPAGTEVAWDAEIVQDQPGKLIAWRSLRGSQIQNRGSVRFEPAPGNRGTYVIVDIEYKPAVGMLGATIARMFREEPRPQLKDDLLRFKQIMEVGEIVRSNGSPDGNGSIKQHPGQPVSRDS